jgi:mycothiol synthase
VVLWIERVDSLLDAAANAAGLTHWRTLLQMRRPLPAAACTMPTRAFTRNDAAALIHVNNRAFSWHPEQGGWTASTLENYYSEEWFDADGLRILEVGGRMRPSQNRTANSNLFLRSL